MTSSEDLIRDGLARLAPTAPADDAAYARVGRAITRRRRQQAAARVAGIAAVGLVAVGGAALLSGGERAPRYSTGAGDTVTTVADATPDRVTFGSASFELPAGWSIISQDDTSMCVGPDDAAPTDECGLELSRGQLIGYEQGAYVDHGDWSWYRGTDPMACPVGPPTSADEPDNVVPPADVGRAPIDSDSRRPVGDRTAVYDRWAAECSVSGFTFTPRAWHLTDPELLIVERLSHPETEAILESFEFAEDAGTDTTDPTAGPGAG